MATESEVGNMLDKIRDGARPDRKDKDGRAVWHDAKRNITVVDRRDNARVAGIVERIQREYR